MPRPHQTNSASSFLRNVGELEVPIAVTHGFKEPRDNGLLSQLAGLDHLPVEGEVFALVRISTLRGDQP